MKLNKKTTTAALMISGILLLPSLAQADSQWYVTALLQTADLDTVNTQSSEAVGGVTRRIDLETDDESGFSFSVGRNIFVQDNGNALSLELNYNSTEFDAQNIAFMGNDFLADQGRSEGQFDVDTLLLRATYSFEFGRFSPFVGLGIGQTDFEVDGRYGGSVGQPNQARPPFVVGNDSATAVEVRAGVQYAINDNIAVLAEYTATDVDDIEFSRRGGGPGGLATTLQQGDLSYDSLNVGFKFSF